MTKEEATKYLKHDSEFKIYVMENGYLFMENVPNSGYNYIIPGNPNGEDISDCEELQQRIGEWIAGCMSIIKENDAPDFDKPKFGWKVKVEVEPIFTDDWLLSGKAEE